MSDVRHHADVGVGEPIPGATITVSFVFDTDHTVTYHWVDGIVASISTEPVDGADCELRIESDRWRAFRSGLIHGEDLLFGAHIDATWEQLLLLQGLYEGEAFATHLATTGGT